VTPVKRFPARAGGPAERVAGFLAHLRLNGLAGGPAETADAVTALGCIDAADHATVRLALRALATGCPGDWRRFDALFDAYWLNAGRTRAGMPPAQGRSATRPRAWTDRPGAAAADRTPTHAGDGEVPADAGGEGRLVASRREATTRRDLRDMVDAERREAERIAERLARAIRDRRARRRRAARRGPEIDLRRTLRRMPARGGEPLDLMRRRRREPPLRLVALLDVSGSMEVYARVFLGFLKGLVGADARARAYLFHTRIVDVTGVLTDGDDLRAADRLSLIAEGFGGGTRIGASLAAFNRAHARRAVGRRTAVLILSDGYDTDPPEVLGREVARIRRRARRLIWLNPLKGWRDYAPVAAGMAAALPHLDALLPANTLESLAVLEHEFERL
jgi:uncharacterized protein with von Willebrand factor type A (vWA) domain